MSELALSLNEWLVLEGTRQVIAAQDDAANQIQVAELLEMNEMTLSRIMRRLEARGLVDRGDSYMSPALRVWVTERGQRLLVRAREVLLPHVRPEPLSALGVQGFERRDAE